ncbi:unnamed protein product [Caenorhabditis auriculariae]|uniref:Golgi to ER traffic protein 4 n=1 Tax=Caenorhabditis auriculariae TaxID=2777116 RepID=A0A8S1H1B1_9PELO|nr:unnamed protein product [Caenorhabditis auriculariae]
MDAKTIERLREMKASNVHYDLLQFYRTKISRAIIKKDAAGAFDLYFDGFSYFYEVAENGLIVDLTNYLGDCFEKSQFEPSEQLFSLIAKVVLRFGDDNDHLPPSEDVVQALLDARQKFIDSTVRWSKKFARGNTQEHRFGFADLHSHIGDAFFEQKSLDMAHNHYLLSNDPNKLSSFLADIQKTFAPSSDADLIIARAVLQLLCLDMFPNAREVLVLYSKKTGKNIHQLPLMAFVDSLMDAVCLNNVNKLNFLLETYEEQLERDPALKSYIDKIGKFYFGFKSPSQGGFRDILKGLMGSDTTEETAKSHLAASSAAQAQYKARPTPDADLDDGFTTADEDSPPTSARGNMEIDDDLD